MSEPLVRVCLNCGICTTERLQKCAFCFQRYNINSYYCSKLCQQKNWDLHKELHRTQEQKSVTQKVQDLKNGTTNLMKVCLDGNLKQLKRILREIQAAEFEAVDHQGLSALNYAICGKKSEIVDALVKFGGKHLVFKTIANNVTCLHQSSYDGLYKICQNLVLFGGRDLLEMCTSDGFTCLHMACQQGHDDVLSLLLHEIELLGCSELVTRQTNQGFTCFQFACIRGHSKIMQVYCTKFSSGSDIKHSFECLRLCCEHGHITLVKQVVESVGHPVLSQMTAEGHTSLYIACQEGFLEIAEYILNAAGESLLHVHGVESGSCLHISCMRGHLDIVKLLVFRGGHRLTRKPAANGCTCLHVACQGGHLEVVKFLVENDGAELVSMVSVNRFSCLHTACKAGHASIVRFLVEHMSPGLIHLESATGVTALMLARKEMDAARLSSRKDKVDDLDEICKIVEKAAGCEEIHIKASIQEGAGI